MKRVLHVMGSLERSGMEMMLMNSYDEWRRQGYECDVVATSRAVGLIAREIRECGYRVFHIPFRSSWRYLPRASFVKHFYQICRSGYDVVHIHTEAGRPVFAGVAKLAGVKQIAVTPHGIFKFHGYLYIRKFLERQLIKGFGCRFGMISEAVRRCEWDQFRIKGFRVWNWLDTSHFRPPSRDKRAHARQTLGIRPEQFVIASVGNCSSTKNHSALLRAISLLPARIQPLYLHVGREEVDSAERKLATSLGIDNEVCFLGSQSDPRPMLWAADTFAMPSLSEGLPISALEALASGVPLVCSRVEGLSEIAAETKLTVFTSTAPDSIAAGLTQIALMDPVTHSHLALSDSLLIRERFSIQRGVRSIVDNLYSNKMNTLQMREEIRGKPRELQV